MKKRFFCIVMAALLLVSMLAACGGASSGTSGTNAGTSTGTSTNTGSGTGASTGAGTGNSESGSEVIKIGVILPFSGASAYVGNAQNFGYQYALEDFMEHYGDQLGCKTIEFVTGDSTGVADTGVSEFERMVNNEGISAVIGTYNSGVAAAIAPVAIKYQIPFMVTNAVADVILAEDSNYVFRTNMGDNDAAPSYIDFLNYLNSTIGANLKNAAVIYEATDYGQGAYENLAGNVFPAAGVSIVLDEAFTQNSGDLSTVINKLKASNADAVFVVMGENDALLFSLQIVEYSVDIPVIAYGGGFIADTYITQAGSASEGVFASASYIYDPNVMGEDALAIADNFVNSTEYTTVIEPFANGWLGMYSLLEAIGRTGGSSDPNEIANALNDTSLTTGDRALLFHPTMEGVQYNDDNGRYNQNTFAGMQFGQVQDGTYYVVFPEGDNTRKAAWG